MAFCQLKLVNEVSGMYKTSSLTPEILYVVKHKGTESPFTGDYNDYTGLGTYLCRQCGLALFRSDAKFASSCGWPSYDDHIKDNVRQEPDGSHFEIVCSRCEAHLGHIFRGEKYTIKNQRYCVNSLSVDFVPDTSVLDTEEAIVAAGCFWGVETLFKRLPGVLKTEVGYTGGDVNYPTYEEVCRGTTGHVEAIRVVFDKDKLTYEDVIKYFFEIHDPAQRNGQGPDIGDQYLSKIFYYNDEQRETAEKVIKLLKEKKYDVATTLDPVVPFWSAEKYHQNYYEKKGGVPYCHTYRPKF